MVTLSTPDNRAVPLSYRADEPLGCSEPPWSQGDTGDGVSDPGGLSHATSHGAASFHHALDTNSCSLPPYSSMHRCQACQDTTTPQLRQAGKAKAARVRMRNLSIWDLQLESHTLHFESVLGAIQPGSGRGHEECLTSLPGSPGTLLLS